MGFIRGGLFVVASVLLFLSLFFCGMFYMISLSLDYDNLQNTLVNLSDEMARDTGVYDEFVNGFSIMEIACENTNSYQFQVSYGVFEIPCEVVGEGADSSYYFALGEYVMSDYYKEHDCSFFGCLWDSKNLNFLLSEQTYEYSWSKVNYLMFVSFILIIALFLLSEKRSNIPIVVGAFLVVLSLLFMKVDSFLYFVEDNIILSFISVFMTQAYNVFLRFMFLGVFTLVIAIVWKLFLIGFKVKKVIDWFKEKTKEKKVDKLLSKKKSEK
ncbi:MAG: hypothetical protein OQK82_00610 [Candidatus Pacearchaeota archaeon]|nr:hypothetical protein [Candidatus Pacearchaeota archaeon]